MLPVIAGRIEIEEVVLVNTGDDQTGFVHMVSHCQSWDSSSFQHSQRVSRADRWHSYPCMALHEGQKTVLASSSALEGGLDAQRIGEKVNS